MVHDEKPRNVWKLTVIEELIRGNDGLVRAASIRTKNGQTNRPITKLYPLEICAENNEKRQADYIEETDTPTTNEQPAPRPQRLAALRARDRFSKWAEELRSGPEC
jgi:hypothetical protein